MTTQFKLKQLVDKPTRGDQILDLVLTNLPQLYDSNAVQTFPPFGMSDHNVVLVTAILNSSYKEQELLSPWKLDDVVPLPNRSLLKT